MGCDYYDLAHGIAAHFPDNDDSAACLCTFPHNDGRALDAERVRSLAYLGAAVVLAAHEQVNPPTASWGGRYLSLPADLPAWIKDEIDRIARG